VEGTFILDHGELRAMTRLLVGTDTERTSERLVDYLAATTDEDDTVFVVNSLQGGDGTNPDDVSEGKAALDILEDGLEGQTTVNRHQYIRGNEPVEDLLAAADEYDVDELVVGIRKHSPVGKIVFGSTARDLLLEVERPTRCVPLASD
jgi:nucleotide-binding universal stress UspA family protein